MTGRRLQAIYFRRACCVGAVNAGMPANSPAAFGLVGPDRMRRRATRSALQTLNRHLGDDGIPQHAQALDFDFGHVAGLQKNRRLPGESNSRRRAREDQVARLQGANLGNVGNHRLYGKDEFLGV